MNRIPLISLFSGAGGLDLGFAYAGFIPRFANDTDGSAPDTYKSIIEPTMSGLNASYADHSYFVGDFSSAFSLLSRQEGSVLVGGPPCQGFSRAGRMDPRDPRSRHVRHFIDAVEAIRPIAFVMENVRALATNDKWTPILDQLRARAEKSGYETELLLLNSQDHGVAQSRERMFLIGIRADAGANMDNLTQHRSTPQVSVRQALAQIRPHSEHDEWQKCRAAITPAKTPVVRPSPFAGMMFNGQGRPLDLDRPAPTISASLGGNHTPIVDQNWLDDPHEAGRSIKAYHSSLVAGAPNPVPKSWRRISLTEAAELQSFPRDVVWPVQRSVGYRQVGNAVPPLLAYEVARRLNAALGLPSTDLRPTSVEHDAPIEPLSQLPLIVGNNS